MIMSSFMCCKNLELNYELSPQLDMWRKEVFLFIFLKIISFTSVAVLYFFMGRRIITSRNLNAFKLLGLEQVKIL